MSDPHERIEKVLFAEDDNDDFEVFEDVIRELKFDVVISRAEDGQILLKLLHEDIPDILFLDILLPKCDGRDCLRQIRTEKKFDHLPIIVYSSLTDFDAIEFCYRNGSNFYVIKPQSYQELSKAIETIFSLNWKKMLYFPTRDNFVVNP